MTDSTPTSDEKVAGRNGKSFYWAESNNPKGWMPMCVKHRSWPCRECGTRHHAGCECSFCDPAFASGLAFFSTKPGG